VLAGAVVEGNQRSDGDRDRALACARARRTESTTFARFNGHKAVYQG